MGYPLNAITQTIYTLDLGSGLYGSYLPPASNVFVYEDCNLFCSPSVAYGDGTGTINNPWNFSYALEQVVAGDKLGVDSGIIVGEQQAQDDGAKRYTPAFRTTNSGTSENPIYIIAKNFAALTETDRTEIRSGATTSGDGWPAFGNLDRNYVYWVGFYCDESAPNNKPRNDSAPAVLWSSIGGGLLYCDIKGIDVTWVDNHSGVRCENSQDFIISDCKISRFKQDGNGSVNQAGVLTYGCRNALIQYCEIDLCGNSIFWKATVPQYGLVARHNILTNSVDTFRLQQLEDTQQNKIYQNLCLNYSNSCIYFSSTATDLPLPQNTFITNNLIARKTNTTNNIGPFRYDKFAYTASNKVFNNIIFDTNNSPTISSDFVTAVETIIQYVQHNYNCYFQLGSNFGGSESGSGTLRSLTINGWQNTYNMDQNSIFSDPLFVDEQNNDFRLGSLSPCLSSGLDILNLLGNGNNSPINIGPYITNNQSEFFGVRQIA